MNTHYEQHAATLEALILQFYYGEYAYDPIEQVKVPIGRIQWFRRERDSANIHPVIDRALRLAPASNLYALVREYPHIPNSGDRTKIAYTRNDADGERDRQTVTTASKYLTRHFPSLPPHTVRDLCATLSDADAFHLWDTTEQFVRAVQEGPRSCMQWDDDNIRYYGNGHHPYEVYLPEYGWRMAVRIRGGQIVGRCLCNIDDGKTFVRSYRRDPDGGYSHSDEALEAWLNDQGFSKSSDWIGCKFAYIYTGRGDGDFLAPYLDGDTKTVTIHTLAGDKYLRITDDGPEYECDRTGGSASRLNNMTCDCCGDTFSDDDDYISAGYHGDGIVGPCCADEYTCVIGRRGNEYFIRSDDAIEVDDRYYDPDYLSDNNIVELANGDYASLDDCIEIDGEWYRTDDDDVTYLEDTGEYAIKDHGCWQCEDTDNWYSDSVDYVEIDGKRYHPDSRTALAAQGQEELDL